MKKAILKMDVTEIVRHPQTGQPVGERKSEMLQVHELDCTLAQVLEIVQAKGGHSCVIAFETEPYDPGAIAPVN